MAETNSKNTDYAKKFGRVITLEKCEEIFGKKQAAEAFRAAALAGGFGLFNASELNGLTLSIPEKNSKLKAKINDALNSVK